MGIVSSTCLLISICVYSIEVCPSLQNVPFHFPFPIVHAMFAFQEYTYPIDINEMPHKTYILLVYDKKLWMNICLDLKNILL